MGLSNNIITILNFLALICSIPIVSSGIWLSAQLDNECVRLARWPVVVLGVLILLVALAGFVGAYWNYQWLLAAYLFFMATLIVLLLALLVFAFVVTRPDGSYPVPGRAYREYRLGGFSDWLRQYVAGDEHWIRIRACLMQSNVCGKVAREDAYFTADQFFQKELSPLEKVEEKDAKKEDVSKKKEKRKRNNKKKVFSPSTSATSNSISEEEESQICLMAKSEEEIDNESGCCKPPTVCGYAYVNPTVWVTPVNPGADPDCYAWSNDQTQLCYGCNSCKAGMIGNLCHEWRKANIALIVAAVALIWVYIIGCSALKNAQTEELFRRYKQGFA